MRFEHVVFFTGAFEDMREFYAKLLGLAMLHENEHEFTMKIGSTNVSFRKASAGTSPFYHFAINIPRNKMREAKKWVASKANLNTENGRDEVFFKSWNAEAIYFEDPAGNVVEFIARHNLHNETERLFSASDFLNVSEVGVVTEDVELLADRLNQLGIPNWLDASEGFVPVGDEEGLFIIVRNERRWYFSERRAGIYPLAVKIQGLGEMECRDNGGIFIK